MAEEELPHEVVEGGESELHRNKRIAVWIGAFAVMLALTEILGQGAQVSSLQKNIEAANHWAFFQAKAERETTYTIASETLEVVMQGLPAKAQMDARQTIEKWRATTAKLHDDPDKKSGTVQLFERAKAAEHERDRAERKHSRYELASAALHIAIVLSSVSIITNLSILVTIARYVSAAAGLLILLGLIQ